MFQLPPLDEVAPPESSSVSCTKCGKITDTHWIKIEPQYNPEPGEVILTPLEILKMTKRLSICTNCGTLRLTN